MNVIQLICGDAMDVLSLQKEDQAVLLRSAQEDLREASEKVAQAIKNGVGSVPAPYSIRDVLLPALEGLGIPFKETDLFGLVVGESMEKVENYIRR